MTKKLREIVKKNKKSPYSRRVSSSTVSTPAQREKARERHWHRTGVSSTTTKWMKDNGFL